MAQAVAFKAVNVDGRKLSLGQFAREIGKADSAKRRLTVDMSAPWHAAYVKMEKDDQKLVFREWQIEYVIGRMGIGARDAAALVDAPKADRSTEQQNAWAAGSMAFLHHVKRTGAKKATKAGKRTAKGKAGTIRFAKVKSVTPAVKRAVMALCAMFDGESLDEQAKQAAAALAFVTA